MNFSSNRRGMGAQLPIAAKRQFQIELDGTTELRLVELLRDGRSIMQWRPGKSRFSIEAHDANAELDRSAFYLVRVTQADNHKGWTSPIWFG